MSYSSTTDNKKKLYLVCTIDATTPSRYIVSEYGLAASGLRAREEKSELGSVLFTERVCSAGHIHRNLESPALAHSNCRFLRIPPGSKDGSQTRKEEIQ